MTNEDAQALARLRSTLAYLEREADRRAHGAHPGMMRLHDEELADLVALLRRELGEGVSPDGAQADPAAEGQS